MNELNILAEVFDRRHRLQLSHVEWELEPGGLGGEDAGDAEPVVAVLVVV